MFFLLPVRGVFTGYELTAQGVYNTLRGTPNRFKRLSLNAFSIVYLHQVYITDTLELRYFETALAQFSPSIAAETIPPA